jgi:hypothetical protein
MTDTNNNSGYRNSGDGNSGYGNSGDGNSGNRNSGYGNSGDGNSGSRNSGDGNSGYGNSCDRSSGIFCTKTPKLFLFNKPCDESWDEIQHPHFFGFKLNEWVSENEMTDQEKIENKDFHITKGYLKKYEYQEAWLDFWNKTDEENKKTFLNLPNFDAEIFKEITGIDVNKNNSCDGKIVEIEGRKYKLVEEK